jgi:thiol-disulfide isomerase/thioredoxin
VIILNKNFLKIILAISVFLLVFGCTSAEGEAAAGLTTESATLSDKSITELKSEVVTFSELNLDICTNDEGKPIIRLFSTTWCPHCQWIKGTYDNTIMEYVNAGFIEAHHWEVDTRDDALTAGVEGVIPQSEVNVFRTYNEQGSIPTFIFGCKYYRVGNGYESQNDLASEEAEFRAIIEALIKESNSQ